LLLHEHATVTICHSRTPDLPEVVREADIVAVAIGRARMVDASMIKPGAIVLDFGINVDAEGTLCGDVDYEAVAPIAGAITPVPGGTGPVTNMMLLRNTLLAARRTT
jgi:methylenetetrahydrofolate dehydrogenase (NADP+)/methenyltetrahydrofolate cyclohydrolase